MALSSLVVFAGLISLHVCSASSPSWPPPITPVWPVQWASLNYTGDFPLGPSPYGKVTLNGSWFYDWPTNQWRQDTCIRMAPGAPTSCKIELWAGNDRRGNSSVGTTYKWANGKCTYAPSMVPAITHPDSFAKAEYQRRSKVRGQWADTWVSNTASWIHYNFSSTMSVQTGLPLRDCGPTMPTPPYAYACSRHTDVRVAAEYGNAAWEAFFALDTSQCVPQEQNQVGELGLASLWAHALLRQ